MQGAEEKAVQASSWLSSDTVLWVGGTVLVVATVGGLVVWLLTRPSKHRKGQKSKTKHDVWHNLYTPEEHIHYLYSALGSNPIDCELLELFCTTYGGHGKAQARPAISFPSNRAVFANEELVQLCIEKLRALLALGIPNNDENEREVDQEKGKDSTSLLVSETGSEKRALQIKAVLEVIATLTLLGDNSVSFVTENGIPWVLRCMDNRDVCGIACSILGSVCQHAQRFQASQLPDTVSRILVAIPACIEEPKVLLELTNILKALFKAAGEENLRRLQAAAEGRTESLVNVLRAHTADYVLALNSLVLLRFVTQENGENIENAVEAGLLPLLVEAAEAHTDDPVVAEAALWVIHNVTVGNPAHKNTLTRLGVVPVIRRVINAFSYAHEDIKLLGIELEKTFGW